MKNHGAENFRAFQSIKPQSSSSAALDGDVFDTLGYDEVLVILDAGVATGAASNVISVRASANSDGSSSTAITGASFPAVTTANDNEIYVGTVDVAARAADSERYILARSVGDGSNAVIFGVSFIGINYKYKPVTQDNTVAFRV